MSSGDKKDDSKATTSQQECPQTKGKTDSSHKLCPLSERVKGIKSYGCDNKEPLECTLTPELFMGLQVRIKGALKAADAAVQKARDDALAKLAISEQKESSKNSKAPPAECDPNSPLAETRRHLEKSKTHLDLADVDKIIFQAFKGTTFKGTQLIDMTGIAREDKKILEEWDKDNKKLLKAAGDGDHELVKELLAHRADPNAYDELNHNSTALMIASAGGHEKIVSELLSGNSNVDIQNLLGRSALMEAAENGHLAVVGQLVEAGANMIATDNSHETAMSLCSAKGHTEVISFLKTEMEKATAFTSQLRGEATASTSASAEDSPESIGQSPELPSGTEDMAKPSTEESDTGASGIEDEAAAPPFSTTDESCSSVESEQVVPDVRNLKDRNRNP